MEVLKVLGDIRGFFGTEDCWCDAEGAEAVHFGHCTAARALFDKLNAATASPAAPKGEIGQDE